MDQDKDEDEDNIGINKEGLNKELTGADGNPVRIPNREEMANISQNKQMFMDLEKDAPQRFARK